MLLWAAILGTLLAATLAGRLIPPLSPLVGALAVAAFLWVPARELEAQGRDLREVGFRLDQPLREIATGLAVCAIVLPPFALAFLWFTQALPELPPALRGFWSPYLEPRGALHGLPSRWGERLDLAGRIAGNGAVALAEEVFYRGWLTAELESRWPPSRRWLGAPMGRGALAANALFALGHLLVFAPWRLLTFFPGLLFAWLRARTGTIAASALCHWIFNVALLLLELAAYG